MMLLGRECDFPQLLDVRPTIFAMKSKFRYPLFLLNHGRRLGEVHPERPVRIQVHLPANGGETVVGMHP